MSSQPVLEEFLADMDRIGRLLGLAQAFRGFGGSDRPQILPLTQWPEVDDLERLAPAVRTDLPILSGSLLLYVAGRFEYFVRQLVETVATELCSRVDGYGSLPGPLQRAYKDYTLEIAARPRRFGYDDVAARQYMRQYIQASGIVAGPIEIAVELISVTETNMRSDALVDILRRVGLENYWRDLSKQTQVKVFFGEQDEHLCTSAGKARLDSLMDTRNQVAHPTGTSSFPDVDTVLSEIAFLKMLATETVGLTEAYLLGYKLGANQESSAPTASAH